MQIWQQISNYISICFFKDYQQKSETQTLVFNFKSWHVKKKKILKNSNGYEQNPNTLHWNFRRGQKFRIRLAELWKQRNTSF